MGSVLTMHRPPTSAPTGGEPADARTAALVERARGGDLAAWSRLYQEHFDRVLRHVTYLVGDVGAAEDLVQETFAQAFVGLARYEARSTFLGWLRGIAVNIVRKHWRSRYRGDQALGRLETMTREATSAADPEGAHLRQRRAEVLLAVLETLPETLREAFVLCDMQDMTTEEAAAVLAVTPGNLRVRATRARARIREELVRLGWLADDARKGGAS